MLLPVISPDKLGVCVKVNKHNNLSNTSLQKLDLPVPDEAGRSKTSPLSYNSYRHTASPNLAVLY